jgi:serine/threonine-protein kinase
VHPHPLSQRHLDAEGGLSRLRVLGAVDLEGRSGATIDDVLAQPKRVGLLAYLALARPHGYQRTDPLLALFWPELDAAHSRAALRQSVYFLRRHLGAGTLLSRGRGEELSVSPDLWCDAIAFETALDEERRGDALELYRGPLLDGFHVTGAGEEFEHWLEAERRRLELRAERGALELSQAADGDGDRGGALQWARRAHDLQPLDEEAARGLIALLDRHGDRAGSLHTYEEFATRLEAELGVAPAPETERLVARIRSGESRTGDSETEPAGTDRPRPAERPSGSGPRPLGTPSPAPGRVTRGRVLRLALAGLAVVLLGAAVFLAVRPEDTSPTAPPTLAVLPFEVHGADPAWREGMVDLLTTRLDGISDLQTISSRTVFARWHERVGENTTPDLERMLSVGRASRARYALVGSAIGVGPTLRLTADVYQTADGRAVGGATVEGPHDHVLSLVDRLSMELLKSLFRDTGPEPLPVDLASITTSSVPALKAYLEGESRFRRSDFDGAIQAYIRAVAEDSTFALAHHRLALSYGYVAGSLSDLPARQSELAARHLDRLPDREALLVRTSRAFEQGSIEAIELARRGVDLYPEDPEAWYVLGEVTYHLGAPALVAHIAGDRALSRAVELDSLFLPAYIHLVHNAFILHADSAMARRRMADFARRRGELEQQARNTLAFDLAFGPPDAASRGRRAVGELTPRSARHIALNYLWHPAFLEAQAEVLRTVRSMPGSRGGLETLFLYFNALGRGRVDEAMEHLGDRRMDDYRPGAVYLGWSTGLPIPEPVLDRALAPSAVDTTGAYPFFAGARAVDRGRWEDHVAAIQLLDRLSERSVVAGDPVSGRFYAGAARGLDGYAAWRRGELDAAQSDLAAARVQAAGRTPERWMVNSTLRLWLGRLAYERGQAGEAIAYFRSLHEDDMLSSLGALHLAVGFERIGDPGAAQTLRAGFAETWEGADRPLEAWSRPGFIPPTLRGR